jgi:hypothetical protein
MKIVLKYGFRDPRCNHVYVSDKLDIKKISKLIMHAEEALVYTVGEISDDGEEHFWINYKVRGCSYDCRIEIKINHLLEINGKLFELPPWGIDYRAIKINSETI